MQPLRRINGEVIGTGPSAAAICMEHKSALQSAQLQGAWLQGAQLQGAILHGAMLQVVRLQGAQLQGAWLQGAMLQGASLQGAFLPTGETFEEYLAIVVPDLCRAGGQPLSLVAAKWGSHEWPAHPMGVAFQAQSLSDVPLLHSPRVVQFLQLYTAGLVPRPVEA